jgi:hypothetical protein
VLATVDETSAVAQEIIKAELFAQMRQPRDVPFSDIGRIAMFERLRRYSVAIPCVLIEPSFRIENAMRNSEPFTSFASHMK